MIELFGDNHAAENRILTHPGEILFNLTRFKDLYRILSKRMGIENHTKAQRPLQTVGLFLLKPQSHKSNRLVYRA